MIRVVAQPGSALVWGARGRWFESSPPDKAHLSLNLLVSFSYFMFPLPVIIYDLQVSLVFGLSSSSIPHFSVPETNFIFAP